MNTQPIISLLILCTLTACSDTHISTVESPTPFPDTGQDTAPHDTDNPDDTPSASDTPEPQDTHTPPRDVLEDTPQDTSPDTPQDTPSDTEPDTPNPCDAQEGSRACPIPIPSFPYQDRRDSSQGPDDSIDSYACAPDTNESGPAWIYTFTLSSMSAVSITVDDVSGDGVDVDIHLLETAPDPNRCIRRDNRTLQRILQPGTYFISVDTWVNSDGDELSGPYTLDVTSTPLGGGNCAMDTRSLEMFWNACDETLDCTRRTNDNGDLSTFLQTPALGPVVKEAHLVTTDEPFPNDWPSASRDQIERHYQLSQQASGYTMQRTESWAPAGEGGSRFGQGSTGRAIPIAAEAWYVNMYWRSRPAAGTRMIVMNPHTGRAVVAAGGYETGPGANTAIGGASEEIHHYLQTTHRDMLIMGFATDQNLPYGPIVCTPP